MDRPDAAPPSPSTLSRVAEAIRRWQAGFALDLRGLALFRILLGVLLLADLALRASDLRVFYSDAGVLPRVDLLDRVATGTTPWTVSLHMISGRWEVQLVLFAIAAFCAACLLIGHRTRLFTVLSWLLLMSLHGRNPAILNAGDVLFRMLMFWSMFLPLGARCSVDAALREPPESDPAGRGDRVWSVPAFCFMVQVSLLYWATALLKTHPIWTEDRTAVWHALKLDYMVLPLGALMREWPPGLLELMTRATLFLELAAPLLLWVPVFVVPLRLTACALMIAVHVGFAATLQLGLFSYVCGAMWLALLPPWAWDRLFARFRRDPRRLGMTLHYDGDCGFCRRMVLVIRSFFLLPETAIAPAQDDPKIERAMRNRDSWVVTDHEDGHHYKFEALAYVLSRSPWAWPVGVVLGARVFRGAGTWLYDLTARHRGLMGRLTGWMRSRPARPPHRPLLWLRNAFLLATVAYVVLWNARGLHNKEVFEEDSTAGRLSAKAAGWLAGGGDRNRTVDYRWYGRTLRISQFWTMFAPHPSRTSGWYVIVGTLADGSQVDLYRHIVLGEDFPEVSWERPDRLVETFHGPRWRKYMMSLRRSAKMDHRPLLCRYLASEWKREFGLSAPLTMVELYFNEERIEAYEPDTGPEKRRLWYYTP